MPAPDTSAHPRSAADRVRRVRRTVAVGSAAAFTGLWIAVVGLGGSGAAATATPAASSTQADTPVATATDGTTTSDDSAAATTDQSLPAVQTGQS